MSNDGVNTGRRRFLTAATSVVGAAGVVAAAVPFVGSWNPSAKAKAAGAPVKIDIGKIEPGQMVTEEWRGKPVYILRRTPEALEAIRKDDSKVADPNSEKSEQPTYAAGEYRSIKDEYLILVGLCTHLGCAPKYRPEVGSVEDDWLGGFFCPCHGSKFDLAGRVYKGVPAPTNLVVPPHRYESDTVIVVGEDQEAA
ncbi:MAG TPA: ubiquinol-cytochrome c reductase iron-sulfur subunit [Spongiibacteraceae bacterium]|jgi:ubiquinol-cytochrome c reductase iron-sulfur subunit|nr:ubiquinol-cytochrome c reductase iron-sulfur subunit [Spongiibacteraceae bacterium]HUH37133.1 ubiquinol-cytochrome c reductase iron-sulfur subunit [Spongiibacteraceae bacterium]